MPVLSVRSRQKAADVIFTGLIITLAWWLQILLLGGLSFQNAVCNLPLTLIILWGFVFGPSLPPLTAEDLRSRSTGDIFLQQLCSGSFAGLLVGAYIGALYASLLPFYPLAYPLIGWIAGYFGSRNFSRETLLCIPVVLLLTVLAELIMAGQIWGVQQMGMLPNFFDSGAPDTAWQFFTIGQSEPFIRLAHIAFPEALLNALIAPFAYFPLSSWYDFYQSGQITD